MTLPAFVSVSTFVNGAGGVGLTKPTGFLAGDILLAFFETANQAITVSGGTETWTELPDSPQGIGNVGLAGGVRLTAFWARASAAAASVTMPTSSDSGDHQTVVCLAISGCIATGDPFDVTSGGTAAPSTSISVPGDTTTGADRLVVIAVATDRDANGTNQTFSGWTNTDLANLTQRADQTFVGASGGGIGLATGEKAAAGAYANTAVTQATSVGSAYMTIALKPPVTGQTVTVNQATETDLSQPVVWAPKARLISQSTETDLAQILTRIKVRPIAQASETDLAQPITHHITVNQTFETDVAQPIGRTKTATLELAVETDTASAVSQERRYPIGQASESDEAFELSTPGAVLLGQAVEIDEATDISVIGGGSGTGIVRSPTRVRIYASHNEVT